ncbi:hypothetical protein Y032_0038g3569 [Ancylostoma ceylanicum]|uniref:Uncharacterized protein n=1 Tax=Ancylostoma ceylanicum TaxID=53326 RepID=A0A016UJD6_9BILA|nr:hypothetical protein Y032_0038g3569 [Ancylostoma ceylanicum]
MQRNPTVAEGKELATKKRRYLVPSLVAIELNQHRTRYALFLTANNAPPISRTATDLLSSSSLRVSSDMNEGVDVSGAGAAEGSLEASSWPFIVYFVVALVSTPLYIAIVVKLFINRNNRKFSSTFYTLLLSQGFADIFYIFCYTVFYMLSYVGTIKDIGSFFKWTLANISYKCLYYSLNLRYVGVTLISFQRYLTICKWRSTYIQGVGRYTEMGGADGLCDWLIGWIDHSKSPVALPFPGITFYTPFGCFFPGSLRQNSLTLRVRVVIVPRLHPTQHFSSQEPFFHAPLFLLLNDRIFT